MKTGRVSLFLSLMLLAWTIAPASPATAQSTKPVQFGKIKTYEHASRWFSMDVPSTWKIKDASKDDEAIVTFTDLTGFSMFAVNVFETEKSFSTDDLGTALTTILKGRYKSFAKYSAGKPKTVNDTRVAVYFKYEFQKTPMTGDAFIELHNDKMMSVLVFVIPTAQYAASKKTAYTVIDSFVIAAPASTLEEITELTEYAHPKGVFSMLYPADWDVTDNTEDGWVSVLFENPRGYSFIMIEAYRNEDGDMTAKEVAAKLEEFVWNGIGKNVKDYVEKDTRSIDGDSASTAFTFTRLNDDGDKVNMVGVMYMQENDDVVTAFRLVLPADSADANTDKLNEIGDSFKVDPKAGF